MSRNDLNEIERVVHALAKKYHNSVYKCEFEDLCQTIWYLVLMAKKKYDPSRGSFKRYAFYFANLKLKDHFWRGANFPGIKKDFSLLHIKAHFTDEIENFSKKVTTIKEDLPEFARLRVEGYTLSEISQKLKISRRTLKRKLKAYIGAGA